MLIRSPEDSALVCVANLVDTPLPTPIKNVLDLLVTPVLRHSHAASASIDGKISSDGASAETSGESRPHTSHSVDLMQFTTCSTQVTIG